MPATVSVVIPNFNNGRASSKNGKRNFLDELFKSLEQTLSDDPALLEILVADDGSTDDSLATARKWAMRRRPDGTPFLRLIELPHCGVLSRVLNRLLAEAKGDIIARLDGDVVLNSARWASALVAAFERDPQVGVVTGAQLLPNGTVHAFGDDLWGPRGYRHIARGASLDELPETIEVDHAMGCFYAARRAVHESVGLYDETILRGQTEEYGVRVRLGGWKVLATSRIVFEHWHVERTPRANGADDPHSLSGALDLFAQRWGFDRLAPDLALVRERFGLTPLWWRDHARLGVAAPGDEWERLGRDREPELEQRCAEEFDLAARTLRSASHPCPVTQIGSGCGCLGIALARVGAAYEGFEEAGSAARAADVAARGLTLVNVAQTPRFATVHDLARVPLPNASRPIVCLYGALERYWNPVGLLRECLRVLAPRGVLCIRTKLRPGPLDDPSEPGHEFSVEELLSLVRHVGGTSTVGFDPQVTASGWLECCLAHAVPKAGRGYFGVVTPAPDTNALSSTITSREAANVDRTLSAFASPGAARARAKMRRRS